jgi:hypothetical protein
MDSAPDPSRILETGMAFWASKTLLSAVEMEVFTELAKHPADLATLRGRLGLHPRAATDFLDALVSLGFLKREEGIYQNTPETDLFLDKSKPSYVGGILEMSNHRLYGFWGNLTTAVRTGEPQNESKGGHDPFAAIYAIPIDDDRNQNAFGLLMSLNMLIETPGGFDYTGADCIGWMKDAGFRDCRVEHLVGPDSMVVGIK